MNEVLLVSIGFSPNVGGIETHFDDLTKALDERGWKVRVLTYKPITTNAKAGCFEKKGKNIIIYRIPWIKGVFYSLVSKPFLEFIFLTPPLFFILPFLLFIKGKNIKTIHSHGLIAGFVSVFWGKIFGKRVITTTHSIYNFPQKGLYRNFARWIFKRSDCVLTLSNQSRIEIVNLGVDENKVKVFTYWLDLDKFNVQSSKFKIRKELGWKNKFVVLFVGRLVEEKGVLVLLESLKTWNKNIGLVIIGTGPLEEKIQNSKFKIQNLIYLGKIENVDLPKYYNAADLLIVPSIHEEGYGRVILEALACGTPVVASKRGAIPEAIDRSVGKLIKISPENIKKTIENFFKNPNSLNNLAKNTRRYAADRYYEKNIDVILEAY